MAININCDLGEGMGNEHLLMPYLSSCNIACGGHAGNIHIIDQVIALALQHSVLIGAHPSYPDKENFGRKVLNISNSELQFSLIQQLEVFQERAKIQEAEIHHIKAHGALYHEIAVNEPLAHLFANTIQSIFKNIQLYVPYQSVIAEIAPEYGIQIIYEVFADRNYHDNLSLVSRSDPKALISNTDEIIDHVRRMAIESNVKTIEQNIQFIKAETFCVHGDNPQVLDNLIALNNTFNSN